MTKNQLIEEYKTLSYWLDGAARAAERAKLLEKKDGRTTDSDHRYETCRVVWDLQTKLRDLYAPEIGQKICREVEC